MNDRLLLVEGESDKSFFEEICKILGLHDIVTVLFQHNDGLADFGLWVMPNNFDDGMLEDWIKRCIHWNESILYRHAEKVVNTLPLIKFKPIHISKAEVATWLAWQKQPGHGLYRAIEDELIDTDSALFKELSVWLTHVYS